MPLLMLTRAFVYVMTAPATGVPVSEMGDQYAQDTFALKDKISEYVSLVCDPNRLSLLTLLLHLRVADRLPSCCFLIWGMAAGTCLTMMPFLDHSPPATRIPTTSVARPCSRTSRRPPMSGLERTHAAEMCASRAHGASMLLLIPSR